MTERDGDRTEGYTFFLSLSCFCALDIGEKEKREEGGGGWVGGSFCMPNVGGHCLPSLLDLEDNPTTIMITKEPRPSFLDFHCVWLVDFYGSKTLVN